MTDRLKYNWISAASKEYDQALAQVFFLSNIHAKVLDVKLIYKELAPVDEVTYWCTLVLDQTESGLIQSLAALTQKPLTIYLVHLIYLAACANPVARAGSDLL